MEWLIVALGLLIAFGGIVYVLPSRVERLRGKARVMARNQGLSVSSTMLTHRDAPAEEKVSAGGKSRKPVEIGNGIREELLQRYRRATWLAVGPILTIY